MVKTCEVCHQEVKALHRYSNIPLIYTMYSSIDVNMKETGAEKHVYTHNIKYICPICRLDGKADWLASWEDVDSIRDAGN